jgi:hypothetical protein
MSRWHLSDWVIGLLLALFIFTLWGGLLVRGGDKVQYPGGDFSQFYTAGLLADRGESGRLYDQMYFFGLQHDWKEDGGLFSLYPPMMALAMMPLARLPFYSALVVWWGIQGACFAASGWILYRMMSLQRRWRVVALMALATLFPVAIAVRLAHLAPMLLLILSGGIALHRSGRSVWAGLLLSLLAVKPQLAVGLVLWLCLRRDFRTLAAMAAGGLAQAAAVAAAFGPAVFLDYLQQLPLIASISRSLFRYSAVFEQSLSGIVDNLLWMHGVDRGVRVVAMIVAHILAASTASILLVRVVAATRPFGRFSLAGGFARRFLRQNGGQARPLNDTRPALPPHAADYEYACAVLFLLLFPPYLLVYDLTLLAIPLALLWSTPRWPVAVVLYSTVTVASATLAMWTGFSLTGLVALWTMFEIALAMSPARARRQEPVALRSFSLAQAFTPGDE